MKIIHTIKRYMLLYGVTIISVLWFNYNVITTVTIRGDSMLPTLQDHSIRLVLRCKIFERDSIVLLKSKDGTYMIKRIIGIEGDEIVMKTSELYVNGVLHDKKKNSNDADYIKIIRVPEKTVFVLGDNRLQSFDSQEFGCVDKSQLVGIVIE